jgi:hypothetical protein
MPEAAIDENHGVEVREHKIRTAGQVAAVKTEAKAACVQTTAHQHLWLGVLAPDTAHIEPPLLRCQNISHINLTPWRRQ